MGNASQRPEGGDKAAVLEKANTEGAKPEKSREDRRSHSEKPLLVSSGDEMWWSGFINPYYIHSIPHHYIASHSEKPLVMKCDHETIWNPSANLSLIMFHQKWWFIWHCFWWCQQFAIDNGIMAIEIVKSCFVATRNGESYPLVMSCLMVFRIDLISEFYQCKKRANFTRFDMYPNLEWTWWIGVNIFENDPVKKVFVFPWEMAIVHSFCYAYQRVWLDRWMDR